jgi:acetylornithine/succinyldiaminopimelate/putrescine aminotransferase
MASGSARQGLLHLAESRRRAAGPAGGDVGRTGAGDLEKVFFTTGGAEANENAVKMARLYTGRTRSSRDIARSTAPATGP